MKGDFIPKFVEAVIEFGKGVYDTWQWESLYYKGFRVSGYDRKRAYTGFKNLEKRGIIEKNGIQYKLTKTGKNWLEKSQTKYFKAKTAMVGVMYASKKCICVSLRLRKGIGIFMFPT
ncbi:MAG: hypothetical protein AAB857_01065 [Patescibacteria group bacterium]